MFDKYWNDKYHYENEQRRNNKQNRRRDGKGKDRNGNIILKPLNKPKIGMIYKLL